jgi:hypothetical protein
MDYERNRTTETEVTKGFVALSSILPYGKNIGVKSSLCADGSTFVVPMPWGKLIDGELSIFILWDLITQRLGTIISTTMV